MKTNGRGAGGSGPVLICGGAGFIGTNLAARLMSLGERVLVYDDLSRTGVRRNLEWLQRQFPRLLESEVADIRDVRALRRCVRDASAVFHFAGQTAVTTSVIDPLHDFSVNVSGTVHLLEELRLLSHPVPFIFTSTNKVYGDLHGVTLRLNGRRYEPAESDLLAHGVSEHCALNFHSPYGCSKGAADQYVIDYARTYGLPNIVFRMSCIYGPHQCGTEDQGWVAHFLIRAMQGEDITIFGDGKQVRDVLYVEDLVDAFVAARENARDLRGRAFNIGGGPRNSISLVELLDTIEQLEGSRPEVRFEGWRVGDQRYYVSDTREFQAATGWQPKVSPKEGVRRLHDWLARNRKPRVSAGVQRDAVEVLQGGGR